MCGFVARIIELCIMKLRATIKEEVHPDDKSLIVEFEGDPAKQQFEVHLKDGQPYSLRMRKWDTWEFKVKWESEIFEDPKGQKSYFTHLYAVKWQYISGVTGD